ncbi:MAG: site-specific integrase [Bacteroidia bacterium]
MAQVNFYLKNPKSKNETLIFLYFSYNKKRFKYSTGELIHPKHWNFEDQKVKKSVSGSFEMNNSFERLEEEVKKAYRDAIHYNKPITNEYLRTHLDKQINPEAHREKDFFEYYDDFVELQKSTKTKATIQKYNACKKHLLAFQSQKRFTILFEKIDFDFYERLVSFFITDLQLMNNTISKYIKSIKAFLSWATDREYNTNIKFKKFKTTQKEAEVISLSNEELFSLYNLEIKNNASLEKVRDVFCFACFTGLRYSDLLRVKKESIKKETIHLVSEKTTESLVIPLIGYAKDILIKYNNRLPVISNQKMNDYLKELGELAEINEEVVVTKFKGVEEIKNTYPKHELLSTHVARKTFVTLSLEKGMRVETLMSITGHKKYSTLKRYINITDKLKSAEMNKTWSPPAALKIA